MDLRPPKSVCPPPSRPAGSLAAPTADAEQVLLPDLGPLGHLDQHDARRKVALLGGVGGDQRLGGRPLELLDALELDRPLVEQAHLGGLVDTNGVLGQAGKEGVVLAASPLEHRPLDRSACRWGQ